MAKDQLPDTLLLAASLGYDEAASIARNRYKVAERAFFEANSPGAGPLLVALDDLEDDPGGLTRLQVLQVAAHMGRLALP